MTNRFKELRESLNLNKKQFAEKFDISANTITNIENGKNNLSITLALEIAEKCNVSLDWLYGISDEKKVAGMDKFNSFFKFKKITVPVEDKTTSLIKEFNTVELSDAIINYYEKISEIEEFKKEKGLPQEAYILWKDSVRKKYESELENDGSFTEYVLIKKDEDFIKDFLYAQARKLLPDISSKRLFDEINI